jgi:hypothetical protein
VEALTASLYSFEESEAFLSTYRAFVASEVLPRFSASMRYQRKPGIRIHLPGGRTVQFHTDEWYGHGPGVFHCWMPLRAAVGSNSV